MAETSGPLPQAVDELRQLFPVIEGLFFCQEHVRVDAAVHVIEGTVLHKGNPFDAGHRVQAAPGAGHGTDDTAAAARSITEQGHRAAGLEHPRHQIAAGEAHGGNQAVQVFVRHRIQFVELPVQIDVRTPEMPDEKFAERSILRVIEGQVCQKDRQAKYRH